MCVKMRTTKVIFYGSLAVSSSLAFDSHHRPQVHRLPSSVALSQSEIEGQKAKSSTSLGDKSRRAFVSRAVAAVFLPTVSTIFPSFVQASDVRAPLELLRPATRIKIFIDQAIDILLLPNDDKTGSEKLERLQKFFDSQPNFMTPEEEKLSKRYLEINTSTAWQEARRKEREARGAELGIDYSTPYDKFNTAIQQWGDNRQFQILRSRQRGLERSNQMRAAFNAYTNNLVFGDAYKLNAEGDAKKSLIRNDALPNVNSVVVSDLDLRDLYRNQVLQNMEDAKAELEYQLKSIDDEADVEEILNYLKKARSSCQEWFNFIPKDDIEAALQSVVARN